MTEEKSAKQSNQQTKSSRQKTVEKSTGPAKPKAFSLNILILYGLLSILATAGFYAYDSVQKISRQATKQWQNALQTLADENALSMELSERLSQEVKAIDDRQQTLNNSLDEIRASMSQWGHLDSARITLSHLSEVEYLIRMGERKYEFEQDITTAHNIIALADQLVAKSAQLSSTNLRAQLNELMTILRSVNGVDLDGTYHTLSALQKTLFELSTVKADYKMDDDIKASSESAKPETWDEALEKSWQSIKSSLPIRRVEAKLDVALAPHEFEHLKLHVIMQIEQAKMALLKRQQGLFRESLNQAGAWLEEYFKDAGINVSGILEELNNTSQLTLEMPAINFGEVLLQVAELKSQYAHIESQ